MFKVKNLHVHVKATRDLFCSTNNFIEFLINLAKKQVKGVLLTSSIIFFVHNFPSFLARKILLQPKVMSWDLNLDPPLNYWVMLWNKDVSRGVERYLRFLLSIDQPEILFLSIKTKGITCTTLIYWQQSTCSLIGLHFMQYEKNILPFF